MTLTLERGTFTGEFDTVNGGIAQTELDTVPVVQVLSPGGADDAWAAWWAHLVPPVRPAPRVSRTTCLTYEFEDGEAAWEPGLTLVERSHGDIDTAPACP